VLRGHSETIGERLLRDLDTLMVLPPTPYDACEKVSTRATSISMVRHRGNDYSVPVAYGIRMRDFARVHAYWAEQEPEAAAGGLPAWYGELKSTKTTV
jgi:hypothetical protein